MLLLAQHLLQLALVSLPAWVSKALPLASLPLANQQPRHLRSAKHLLLASPHNRVSVRLLLLVAEDQRSDNPRTHLKTPDSASHLRWAVVPQHLVSPLPLVRWVAVHQRLGNPLLRARAPVLASPRKWAQSLLSDSQHLDSLHSRPSDKHQSQHLVKQVEQVSREVPARSQQRHQSQVVSHKPHNNPRQASANPQHSALLQASPVPSPQPDRASNSSSLPSQLHLTTTPHHHRQIHSAAPHNPPLANPLNQLPKTPSAQEQQQVAHPNPPSANQPNPQPAPSVNPHNQPRRETPSAKHNHRNSHNSQTAPPTQRQQQRA